jgi:hypothetical protein
MSVHSGTSISGFNFSPLSPVNFVLNAIIKQRIPSVRSYYSLRTLCPLCASAFQYAERTKLMVIAAVVSGVMLTAVAIWLIG